MLPIPSSNISNFPHPDPPLRPPSIFQAPPMGKNYACFSSVGGKRERERKNVFIIDPVLENLKILFEFCANLKK